LQIFLDGFIDCRIFIRTEQRMGKEKNAREQEKN
jgi:hypothetical protein